MAWMSAFTMPRRRVVRFKWPNHAMGRERWADPQRHRYVGKQRRGETQRCQTRQLLGGLEQPPMEYTGVNHGRPAPLP
jgi:hypothetical protein